MLASSSALSGGTVQLQKSSDSGATWQVVYQTASGLTGGYTAPVFSAVDDNVVFWGGVVLNRSLDGGVTWSIVSSTTDGSSPTPHLDHQAILLADNATLLDGTDGGLWKATALAATRLTWTNLNGDLNITQVYPGASMDVSSLALIGGAQDTGVFMRGPDGSWLGTGGPDIFYTQIDPEDPSHFFAVSYAPWSLIECRSFFNGSFVCNHPTTNGLNPSEFNNYILTPLVIASSEPKTMFLGAPRVYSTSDGGANWSPISGVLAEARRDRFGNLLVFAGTGVGSMAVSRTNASVIYAGFQSGDIWMTRDRGASWNKAKTTLPVAPVSRIVVAPDNDRFAFAVFRTSTSLRLDQSLPVGRVFYTTDGGQTWTDITGDLPAISVYSAAFDSTGTPPRLYVGNEVGVYRTSDGLHWEGFSNGLPTVRVTDLMLKPDTGTLVAATYGRGLWTTSSEFFSASARTRAAARQR